METNNTKKENKMKSFKDEIKKYKASIISIVMMVILLILAVLCHLFLWKDAPFQFLAACLGAGVTVIITNLLLVEQDDRKQKQHEDERERDDKRREDERKREEERKEKEKKQDQEFETLKSDIQRKHQDDLEKFKQEQQKEQERFIAKLKVYSDFVSKMYEALSDNHVEKEEMISLRTELFGKVSFYAQEEVFEKISQKLDFIKENEENVDEKMAKVFSEITSVLQEDSRRAENTENNSWKGVSSDTALKLWNKFQDIIDNISDNNDNDYNPPMESEGITATENKQEEKEEPQRLKELAWHFNGMGNKQFELLDKEKEEYELSLIEYGEYWRTNLLKQVTKGDVIMLFRRGGYGYVGAFEAIGRRIFDFEKGEEEILYFDDEKPRPVENFDEDVAKYDIYKSKEDGATLCSNLIVKRLAYVPDGVGNPGGVYRRTISRYDSHYAWKLKKRFQEKGQWTEP